MGLRLDKVLTVGEVAALAGWHRRRMLRRLLRLHAERAGGLLVNVGTERKPRWTVTLGRLQEVAPQWFVDDEGIEARLDQIEADSVEMRAKLEALTMRLLAMVNRGPVAGRSSTSGKRPADSFGAPPRERRNG